MIALARAPREGARAVRPFRRGDVVRVRGGEEGLVWAHGASGVLVIFRRGTVNQCLIAVPARRLVLVHPTEGGGA